MYKYLMLKKVKIIIIKGVIGRFIHIVVSNHTGESTRIGFYLP